MTHVVGIDVGGTHADGVLLHGGKVLVKKKVLVDQSNLVESIISLLETLVAAAPHNNVRIQLSTTLCTNAIVRDELDEVGMFIQSGPGMNPSFLKCGPHLAFMNGAIDHRGHILKYTDPDLIDKAATEFEEAGIKSVGIVTKFSHRNHLHEQQMHDSLKGRFPHLSMGHMISGLPNFPRRVYSTWLNAALKSHFLGFREAITEGLRKLDLNGPCYILKADGGTMPFDVASTLPCESVHSGPSASVMGCLALRQNGHDAVLLDIGGTTTDIAILADGLPLFAPYGVTVLNRPTLIRALNTRSVGLGGDSEVTCVDGAFTIGPLKKGPPMAIGGQVPTPTDAMIVLGTMQFGSKSAARDAMVLLASEEDPEITAAAVLAVFTRRIKEETDLLIEEVFSRPVFSVSALLSRKRLRPEEVVTVGGPAKAMQESLANAFELPCIVPEHFEVANAIGAGRTRPTLMATLYADTSDQSLSIPEISYREKISNSYSMSDAEDRLTKVIHTMAKEFGMIQMPEVDFLERQELNTIKGFRTTGKILSVKAQIQPGLDHLLGGM